MGSQKKRSTLRGKTDEDKEEDAGSREDSLEDFKNALPPNAPRFALLDYHYESEDGRPQEKMTFVFWSPDEGANVKDKMLYASSKDAIKKKYSGRRKSAVIL